MLKVLVVLGAAMLALTAQTPPAQTLPVSAPAATVPAGTGSKVVDPTLLTRVEFGLHVHGIAKDPVTGDLYVSDWKFKQRYNILTGMQYFIDDSVRRITPAGEVSRIADITRPNGMVLNPKNHKLYVVTGGSGCLKRFIYVMQTGCPGTNGIVVVDPATGEHHDLAGKESGFADGDYTTARFAEPAEIALDPESGMLYIAEPKNHRVRRVAPSGVITTLAGTGEMGSQDGAGAAATFN